MMQLPTTLPATDTMTVSYVHEGYSGTIPTEFGLLTKLTELAVTNNGLSLELEFRSSSDPGKI